MEILFSYLKSNIETQANQIKLFTEENINLHHQVNSDKISLDELNTKIRVLDRENEKWLEMVIEKDRKEKDLKEKLEEVQKMLEEKSIAYTELLFKFNSRLNPQLRRQFFGDFANTTGEKIENSLGIGGSSKNLINLAGELQEYDSIGGKTLSNNNLNENIHVHNLFNETVSENKSSQADKTKSKVTSLQNPLSNFDIKDLVRSRNSRNTVSNKGLKFKVSEKHDNKFEHRKMIIENNILSLDKDQMFKQEILSAIANKKQFELYMNKGINIRNENLKNAEVQTDVQGSHIDSILDQDMIKSLHLVAQQINLNIEALNDYFTQFDVNLNLSSFDDAKTIFSVIKDKYVKLMDGVGKILDECDIVIKENDQIKTEMEKCADQNDNMKETYTEIFNTFVSCLKDSNTEISDFMRRNTDVLSANPIGKEISNILNNISYRNSHTVEKDTVSPIYKFISKPSIQSNKEKSEQGSTGNIFVKRDRNSSTNVFNGNNKAQSNDRLYQVTNNVNNATNMNYNYKIILHEFNENKGKIKVNISAKKTVKMINSIYFDMIEKIYFKKEKLNFDNEDHFIDFGEILYIYFTQNFGLENLAKKKFLEFLQAISNFEASTKRIAIFSKLIQLHKNKNVSGIFEKNVNGNKRASIRKASSVNNLINLSVPDEGLTNNNNNNLIPNTPQFYDIFVVRQILLFIQFSKINNLIIKSTDDNSTTIYLLHTKLFDNILQVYSKFPLTNETKNKIHTFIDKNKKTYTKNMKIFPVVDFDDLIECISEILIELKAIYSKILKTVFSAIDYEGKSYINLFEFLIVNQYLFAHKLSYDQVEAVFNRFKINENKYLEDTLPYEQFEVIAIEGDLLDIKSYNEYLKISTNDRNELINVIKTLQDELKGSAMSVIDDIMRRLSPIHNHHMYEKIINKVHSVKNKVINFNVSDSEIKNDLMVLWVRIRLIDDMSLEIYNEYNKHLFD
jgi:hypothetical protein